MADRVFATVVLLITIGYGIIAFTAIEAPFQYDPLGPEAWPRLLAIFAAVCCLYILVRPDAEPDWGGWRMLARLTLMVIALVLYAIAFERLGFIISTTVFCAALAWWFGIRPLPALAFGLAVGVVGYFACTELLVLNLPAGRLLPL